MNLEKIISSCLTKGIKRNRVVSREAYRNTVDPICTLTLKYPYVCNGCKDKYTCRKKQYKYDVKRVQEFADYRLVVPRSGI